MSVIVKQDSNGVKPLLQVGELGYDNYPTGGDVGRVYVGTGTSNIAQAKRSEVTAVDSKVDTHVARVDNPHGVTKAQVGLGNVDNTSDVAKNVLSATKLATPRNITISGEVAGSVSFDGSADVNISTTIQPNSVALGTDTTGNYVNSVIAGAGVTVTGVVGEGWTPSIAITPVGTAGTYTKVSTNDKGQVVSGEYLAASDIPSLDASKITSGIIDAARLPAYVDDVLEYAGLSVFPVIGETGKIYIALDTNKAYRWSGSTYVYITSGAVDSVAGKTGVVTLVKADVGLGNVDNTSDINKPISTATQNALDLKANLDSPTLTGTPLAPTASTSNNTTQIATTAFVQAQKANIALTGTPTTPTAVVGTNTTQIASTAYVKAEISNETYSKTQLNAGQLDNRYYTETELNSGALDIRYYTEAEIDAKLAAQNDASEISVTPSGNLVSTNVQAALVELQGDIDNRYTKAQADVLLAGKVDDSEIASVNLLRADKYLTSQNIANMSYIDGNLAKIQYNNATDVDYEVFAYNSGNLTSIQHYISGVLRGTTTLSYGAGNLVSAVFVAV